MIKKTRFFSWLFVLFLFSITLINGVQEYEDLDEFLNELESLNPDDLIITRQYTPQDVLEFLIELHAAQFIATPLYLHSNEIPSRPVLDLPTLRTFSYFRDHSTWKTSFFYNKMHNMYLVNDSPHIDSYINLSIPNIISEIVGIDFPSILSLFQPMKLQERRMGLMFEGTKPHHKWRLGFKIPLYYLERNYYFTKEEENALRNAPIFTQYPLETGSTDESDFIDEHLISDKFGLGDLRISIGYDIAHKSGIDCIVGGELTIPTAVAMGKGLKGQYFKKNIQQPNFDLQEFIIQTGKSNYDYTKDQGVEFLVGALDRLSALTIDSPLGNYNHVGIGLFGQIKIDSPYFNLSIENNTTLEYIIPHHRKRFFILSQNPADFPTDTTGTAEQVEEKILYFQNHLIEKFYPSYLKTKVSPGFIFKATTEFQWRPKQWELMGGLDLWIQSKEKLSHVTAAPDDESRVEIEAARKAFALQAKVLGSITYNTARGSWWRAAADIGFSTTGIGNDYTFVLEYGVDL